MSYNTNQWQNKLAGMVNLDMCYLFVPLTNNPSRRMSELPDASSGISRCFGPER